MWSTVKVNSGCAVILFMVTYCVGEERLERRLWARGVGQAGGIYVVWKETEEN